VDVAFAFDAPEGLKGTLDEVMGWASLWGLTDGARTLAL
jgi:hypothetical protein